MLSNRYQNGVFPSYCVLYAHLPRVAIDEVILAESGFSAEETAAVGASEQASWPGKESARAKVGLWGVLAKSSYQRCFLPSQRFAASVNSLRPIRKPNSLCEEPLEGGGTFTQRPRRRPPPPSVLRCSPSLVSLRCHRDQCSSPTSVSANSNAVACPTKFTCRFTA